MSFFYFWNMYLLQKDFDRATMDIELLVKNETGNDATLQYLVNENPTIEAAWTTIINKGTNTESTYVFPEN